MRSSAGEHLVHTEGVTGSIPVASTIPFNALAASPGTGRQTGWPIGQRPGPLIPNANLYVPFLFLTRQGPAAFCSAHAQPRNVPSPTGQGSACSHRAPADRRPDDIVEAALMIVRHYLGLTHDQGRARLARIEAELIDWRSRCRPMGPQYLAVSRILDAIRDGRLVLTGRSPDDGAGHRTPVG